MKKPVLYLLGLWLILGQSFAQDIRYSQYFNTPLTMNPALTGVGIEYLRATISYRRQAAGPSTPFSTKGLSVDKSVGRFGLGFAINSNGAGETSIKTLQLAASLSYGLPFGYKQSNRLTAGLQVGAINKSLDPTKLTFDNQYSADIGYNQNIASGETFETNSIIRPAVSMGLHWKRNGNKKNTVKPHLSYALQNINQPDISFFGDEVRYQVKHVVQGGTDIVVSDEFQLKPAFYHINQGPFNETGFGIVGAYQNNDQNEIHGGIYGKAGKAMVLYAGYKIDRFLVGMSYDVMTGPVKDAGKGYNAFELSLTFTPKARERKPKTTVQTEEAPKPNKPVDKQNPRTEVRPTVKPADQTANNNTITKTDTVKPHATAPIAIPSPDAPRPIEPVTTTPTLKAHIDIVIGPTSTLQPDRAPTVSMVDPEDVSDVVPQQPVLEPTTEVKDVLPIKTTPQINNPIAIADKPVAITPEPITTTQTQPVETAATATSITTEPVVTPTPEKPIAAIETPASITAEPSVTLTPEATLATVAAPAETPSNTSVVPSVFTPIVPNNKIVAADADGDGVNDYEDPCPFIKGSLATRGCPDSDDDGIVDMVDFCPLESGPKTNGGCPVKATIVSGAQKVVATFDPVLFNTGSTTLTIDNTYDIIERAVELMYQDKNTFVLISGHTDAEGDAASNMNLSQLRADKVTNYFVQQGIRETRIKTIPYGENMPITGNGSELTRKLNRRVEITILKRAD